MRNILKTLSIAGLLALGATAASAQDINFRIGVGDDRPSRVERRERIERRGFDNVTVRRRFDRNDDVVVRRRFAPVAERRIIERRAVRPVTRTVCRTEIRRTFRPNGVVVTRPVQICRQGGPARRVIIRR